MFYDPVAKAFSSHLGQVTVDGIGKVNASKPKRRGEFEFYDPMDCADYMAMPRRLHNVELDIREIKNLLQRDCNGLRNGEMNSADGK